MRKQILISILMVIFLASFAASQVTENNYFKLAIIETNGNTNYTDTPVDDVKLRGYNCSSSNSSSNCTLVSGVFFDEVISSGNYKQITYPEVLNSTFGYGIYAYKLGYIPGEILSTWAGSGNAGDFNRSLGKQRVCKSLIDNKSVVFDGNANKIIVQVKVNSPIDNAGPLDYTPAIISEYYKTNVSAHLEVKKNGQDYYSEVNSSKVMFSDSADFGFDFAVGPGNYTIKVFTTVDDAKCLGSESDIKTEEKIINTTGECLVNSDCGTDGFVGGGFCSSTNVFQSFITFTCNNPGTNSSYCSNSTAPQLAQNCGTSSCGSFGNNYCKIISVYHNRTCFDNGCAFGICFSNPSIEEAFVQTCANGCSNGVCLPPISCSNNSDCGNESFSANYCKNNSVVRDRITPGCASGYCFFTNTTETVEVCTAGCDNGNCISNATLLDFYIDNFYTEGTLYDNESSSVRFHTHNINGTNITSVPVAIYLNNAVIPINSLPFPSQNFDWGLGFGILNSGFYNLTIKVDPQNIYQESNEADNLATFFFNVFSPNICSTVPSTVINLHVSSKSSSHILWSWINPSDSDFNGTIVFLDGIRMANLNKNQSSYDAQGLEENTKHTLIVHTTNICGNLNNTDVSSTASTNKENGDEVCNSCGRAVVIMGNETIAEEPIQKVIQGTVEGPTLTNNKKPQTNPYLALWIIFLLLVFLLLAITLIIAFRRIR